MSTLPEASTPKSAGPENSEPLPPVLPAPGGWQRELSQAIRTVSDLLFRVGLDTFSHLQNGARSALSLPASDSETHHQFPVLVPENYLARMRRGDPDDPLLRQVLPVAAESQSVTGFTADAVGDLQSRRGAGILQKYAGRVLLITTGACAVHCRYCFRREYPYGDEPRRMVDWQPALNAIASDPTVTEVIFSGGDPLMLSDVRLSELCRPIDSTPHIERIRFHTRLPIVLPSRVTQDLLAMLSGLRSQPIMVVHANHANEVVGDCAQGLRAMVRAGIPVLNQAVLLRGINDTAEAQEALNRKLINLGVMPYYLHQLDHVSGTAHFEVAPERGLEIIRELTARLPGYAIPRYVQEVAGEPGKSMVVAATECNSYA